MHRMQQAGPWRPADGAPLERGVMHQPTPSRKVHFPGLARRPELRQTSCTATPNTNAAALPAPEYNQRALGVPAPRTGLAPSPQASTPLCNAFRPPRNTAAPSPARCQHVASAAGPSNMVVLGPRSKEPPGQEQPGAHSLPYSTRESALLHQRFKNPHSRLFWISASGRDPGLFF